MSELEDAIERVRSLLNQGLPIDVHIKHGVQTEFSSGESVLQYWRDVPLELEFELGARVYEEMHRVTEAQLSAHLRLSYAMGLPGGSFRRFALGG